MPYPFPLPTTSNLPISKFLRCETHPSLILAATTRRNVLRSLLKKQKKQAAGSQNLGLSSIKSALDDYLPYVLAIEAGLTGQTVGDEEIDVCLVQEIEAEWTPKLAVTIPGGRDLRRIKGKGLDYELCYVLHALAITYTLLARSQIYTLYASTTPAPEQRSQAIESAIKLLLEANSIHRNVSTRASEFTPPPQAKDILSETQSALASLAFAEATLLFILKSDPYPAIVIQERNKSDNEWMYKAPDIPKVRVALFVRLAVQAADHASRANALLSGVDDSFAKYAKNLHRTARAKACRFSGMDVELGGKVGEAIAWLVAAKRELGFKVEDEGSSKSSFGLSKLKKDWSEKREDRKLEKGSQWGADAGKYEEGKVVSFLDTKWNKANDLVRKMEDMPLSPGRHADAQQVNPQLIPSSEPLASGLPSGRNFVNEKPFVAPVLDSAVLAQMRAPVDRSELEREEAESGEDSDAEDANEAPGAFPAAPGEQTTYY